LSQVITIGTGTTTGAHIPIEPWYGYTYSQSIYYQSEINTSGQITKIAWYYAGSAWTDNITIYTGTTTSAVFSSTSSWIPITGLTQVYTGNLAVTATAGWYEITLQQPFLYTNSGNLVICVDENTPGYHLDSDEFYCTTTYSNRSIYYYSDSYNPVPSSPPTGTLSFNYPNVRLTFSAVSTTDMVALNWLLPQTAYNLTSAEQVKIRVQNQGSVTVSSFNLSYSVNGGSSYTTETVNQSIAFGQTYDYVFSQTANLSAPGSHSCKAYVSITGDTIHSNDTITAVVVNVVQGDSCNLPLNYGLINSPAVTGATTFAYDAVWYSFTLDTLYVNVIVSLCGSSYDTYLQVINNCSAGTQLAINDDSCGLSSQVSFTYLPAGTYIAKVYGYTTNFGNYILTITGTNGAGYILGCTDPNASNFNSSANLNDGSCLYLPDGSICEDPINISLPLVNFQGSTIGFGDYYANLPCGGSYFDGNDIVYRFTVTYSGFLNGSVAGNWAGMAVLNSCPFTQAQCIASATGYNGGSFSNIPVSGGTYYVIISSYPEPQQINFTMSLSMIVPGCNDPAAINYNPAANQNDGSCIYQGTTCTSSLFYGFINDPPVTGIIYPAGEKWYCFGLAINYSNVEISLCNSDFDTQLELWHNCNDSMYMIQNNDLCGNRSLIGIPYLGSGLYYTRVYGNGNSAGNYELSITGIIPVPPVPGCTDTAAINYNPYATIDDGSCQYPLPPNPGWNYTITSTNHIILIQSTIPITLNGVQITPGDFIGVFFDSLGTLSCAGYLIWEGITSTIAAWGSTGSNNGFATGESFKWKIWNHLDSTIFTAVPTYLPSPGIMPNGGYYQPYGLSGLSSLVVSTTVYQAVTLLQGWSIISTYIIPVNPSIISVFSPVVTDVIIIKNGTGQVYWPQFGVNQIGNMVTGHGYSLKMTSYHVLNIDGVAVIPESTLLSIVQGWSLIGYLRNSPASVVTMMSSIVTAIDILKNGTGQVYWPYYNINNIGNMNPGEGYQIKLSASQVLVYPPN
jgi:hypothetical protein